MKLIPFSPWPNYSPDEVEVVSAILRSGKVNYWTGEEGKLFEKEFSEFVNCDFGVALANGTVALEIALRVLGIGPGDEVITTSRTFMASASCAVMLGAKPIFADVDPVSQNITAASIREVISSKTKAIIAVHLAGWPCEMHAIMELAREHGLKVIEDCAQAHGATYHEQPVGSLGHIAAYSFCQDKIMSTGGEGGMLTTSDLDLWQSAWAFKDHGKSYEAVHKKQHAPDFRWLHESFGTNARLTEMQSAIGRIHLRKLPQWLSIRRSNAAILTECFSDIPSLRVTLPSADMQHAYYKYYVFIKPEYLAKSWDRNRVMNSINAEGIPCFSGSCSEIYREKAFERQGMQPALRLKVARELGETSLMFLVHPTLNENHMYEICRVVKGIMKTATKIG